MRRRVFGTWLFALTLVLAVVGCRAADPQRRNQANNAANP